MRTLRLFWAVVGRGRCPCCREGALFAGVFRFAPCCSCCGLEYEQWVGDWITPTYLAGTAGTLVAVAVVVGFFAAGRVEEALVVWWALGAACVTALIALRPSKAGWLAFMWAVGGVEVSAETRAALRWRDERGEGLLADAEARARAQGLREQSSPKDE